MDRQTPGGKTICLPPLKGGDIISVPSINNHITITQQENGQINMHFCSTDDNLVSYASFNSI